MQKVFVDMTMSFDGFTAGPDVSVEQPLGEQGDRLEWFGDDVNRPGDRPGQDDADLSAKVLDELSSATGAVIMGKRTFDVSVGPWGDNPPIHLRIVK